MPIPNLHAPETPQEKTMVLPKMQLHFSAKLQQKQVKKQAETTKLLRVTALPRQQQRA